MLYGELVIEVTPAQLVVFYLRHQAATEFYNVYCIQQINE